MCESCEVKTENEAPDHPVWCVALQKYMPRGIIITKAAPAVHKMGIVKEEITMISTTAEKKHFYQFDIVKFVAAILIVPMHYQEYTGLHNEGFNFSGGWIPFANLVELFFILSGLFTAVQTERDRNESFLRFMQKKFVRLWPMCALSVTVTAVAGWIYRILTGQWFLGLPIGIWIYTKSALLIFAGGGLRDGSALNYPLWYVCVLLVCYVLYKFILQIAAKWDLPLTYLFLLPIVIGTGALQYGIELPFLNWRVSRGYVAFFLGIELYHFTQKYRSTKCLKSTAFAVLCGCSIPIVASFYCNPLRELIDDWYMILTFLLFPALVVFMLTSKAVERLFDRKIFGPLGAFSFEIYIWHLPMMYVCALAAYLVGYPVTCSTKAMLIFVALVVVMSPFMYYLVERPVTRFLVNRITVHAEEKPAANTNKNIP